MSDRDAPTQEEPEHTEELSEDELPTMEADEEVVSEPGLPDKLYFRIGEISQHVGVDAHVLRYWESEFRMKPHRSTSGQRLYRKSDLARFLRIRRLLHDEGYTIAGARKILTGAAQPAATTAAPPADAARLKEVLDRLESLRAQIRAFRDEIAPPRRVDASRGRS